MHVRDREPSMSTWHHHVLLLLLLLVLLLLLLNLLRQARAACGCNWVDQLWIAGRGQH